MELPNYRLPSLKSVALLLWEKAKDFLQQGLYGDFSGYDHHLVPAKL